MHADTRVPLMISVWMLRCCLFAVAMFEWLRVFEFRAPRPQMEQVRAIEVGSIMNNAALQFSLEECSIPVPSMQAETL